MTLRFHHLAAAAFAASLSGPLLSTSAFAEAVDLFGAVTPADAQNASARLSDAVVRERLVKLNLAALEASETISRASGALDSSDAPKVRINLFPGASATFSAKGVEPTAEGGSVWRGATDEGDAATLILVDGKATGRVTLDGRTYRISPTGGKAHRIVEIARKRLPRFGPSKTAYKASPAISAAPGAPSAVDPVPEITPDGRMIVTVLFAYTEKAKAASQNIMLDALMSLELANDAFNASKVKIKLKPVGMVPVRNYDEDNPDPAVPLTPEQAFKRNLDDVSSTTMRQFSETHFNRDKKGADLVVLLREEGAYCGVAWIGGQDVNDWSPTQGFSVVRRDCIDIDVVAHELGHNFGLHHDRYVEETLPKHQYNFGFIDMKQRYRDVMSYPDKCFDFGFECKGINVFSNPQIKYNGRPFGVEQFGKGAADSARWLNEHHEIVARYRRDKPIKGGGASMALVEE